MLKLLQVVAVSAALMSCGGGGGGSAADNTASQTTGSVKTTDTDIKVDGSNLTTTVNKPTKVKLLISGSNNTIHIQTAISELEISGSNHQIDFANGVTVDKCSIVGSNNKATKSDLLILNCDIAGANNKGF